MWFVIRELIGWVLTIAGLVLIAIVLMLALQRNVLEALALSLPSTIVFRAGIGFLRLTTAGRIAAQLSLDEQTDAPRDALGRRGLSPTRQHGKY